MLASDRRLDSVVRTLPFIAQRQPLKNWLKSTSAVHSGQDSRALTIASSITYIDFASGETDACAYT
jgi:hypothetical protein